MRAITRPKVSGGWCMAQAMNPTKSNHKTASTMAARNRTVRMAENSIPAWSRSKTVSRHFPRTETLNPGSLELRLAKLSRTSGSGYHLYFDHGGRYEETQSRDRSRARRFGTGAQKRPSSHPHLPDLHLRR